MSYLHCPRKYWCNEMALKPSICVRMGLTDINGSCFHWGSMVYIGTLKFTLKSVCLMQHDYLGGRTSLVLLTDPVLPAPSWQAQSHLFILEVPAERNSPPSCFWGLDSRSPTTQHLVCHRNQMHLRSSSGGSGTCTLTASTLAGVPLDK